ncbi:MAG TPA: FAD-dependent monooxygenase [Bryobacteraceae bacterium]|jgi:2-polyprenyl-6-methoxyphenol hydroxylase-like FAD-dependent oxidoreductase|nr:FAD-dependent monooxygenase [Bryobacteraceae bacterium]
MKSIGIVGGGIGGVTAAAALHKFGIHATVYERAPLLKEAGAGMMLWPNATRVLKSLGVLESVVTRSGLNTNFLVRSSRGKVLMNIALGDFDVPALCARRSDVLTALLAAVPAEQISLGREFVRIEQSKSKVRIEFNDGSAAEHDALIAADGLRSRVRAQLFGVCDPVYRGYTVWRGVTVYAGSAIQPGDNSETWGHGSRFGILDIGSGRFTWYATANTPQNDPASASSPGQLKERLSSRFGAWHDPIPHLVEEADFILENPAYDLPPLRRWTSGRVTLLGDAAHPCTPNLGQGGGMAIEDALVLAKCLADGRSVNAAFSRYESLRRARTRHIQQRSRLMGNIGQWENRAVVAGRRAVTRMLPAALFELNLRRTYSYEA